MSRYSDEFRLKCIKLVLVDHFSISDVASSLLVGKRTLYKWINDYKKAPSNVADGLCFVPEFDEDGHDYVYDSIEMAKVSAIKRLQSRVKILERVIKLYERTTI